MNSFMKDGRGALWCVGLATVLICCGIAWQLGTLHAHHALHMGMHRKGGPSKAQLAWWASRHNAPWVGHEKRHLVK